MSKVQKKQFGERVWKKQSEFLQTKADQLLTVWLAYKTVGLIDKDKQGEAALKLALKYWERK